jgi:2'-5' RNA ligase
VSKGHRLFFALVPDEAVRARVTRLQRTLAVAGRAARPHQFHATLAFLGMQRTELIPEITQIAFGLNFPRCRIVMDRVGSFKRTGVLWLGVSETPEVLAAFQHSLVGALLEAGIGYDRKPWKFHLTLYRKMRKRPVIMDPVAIEWRLRGFSLVESIGVKNGVEYHEIGHWEAVN